MFDLKLCDDRLNPLQTCDASTVCKDFEFFHNLVKMMYSFKVILANVYWKDFLFDLQHVDNDLNCGSEYQL